MAEERENDVKLIALVVGFVMYIALMLVGWSEVGRLVSAPSNTDVLLGLILVLGMLFGSLGQVVLLHWLCTRKVPSWLNGTFVRLELWKVPQMSDTW